jgi:uncharacterized membrane protein
VLVLLGVFAIGGMGDASAQRSNGQRAYSVTDFGPFDRIQLYDINDAGSIVGIYLPEGATFFRGFVWRDGVLTDVGTFGDATLTSGLSPSGVVVGYSRSGSTFLPFYWRNGVMKPLTMPVDANHGSAIGVNASGLVVGDVVDATGYQFPVMWRHSVLTDLNGYTPQTMSPGQASRVNARGQIVGTTFTPDGQVAVLWEKGKRVELPGLGGPLTWAAAINDAGQIVGGASLPGGSKPYHPVLWDRDGTVHDLGSPNAVLSTAAAIDINNRGQVLVRPGGFLWENNAWTDLNTLLPPDSGWTIVDVFAINNSGDIVAEGRRGGEQRAILMKEVHPGE